MRFSIIQLPLMAAVGIFIVGCTSTLKKDGPPRHWVDVSKIPDAKPEPLPKSRYGNPTSYHVLGKTYHVLPTAKDYKERGIASWYGRKFQGQLTSTRERYDMLAMTAASPVLPIPSFVRVTNLKNGRSVVVKVNDRGPFAQNRILDLSYAAAKKLGYEKTGTAYVEVAALDVPRPKPLAGEPKLYLQIGAYKNRAQAESIGLKIEKKLHRAYSHIEEATVNHRTWYRLQLGPIEQVSAADKVHEQVHSLGYTDAYTVIR
jgi:rare lipoprotein A